MILGKDKGKDSFNENDAAIAKQMQANRKAEKKRKLKESGDAPVTINDIFN